MGVHSGKYGVINGWKTIRNWGVEHTSTPFRYRASNTRNGMSSMAGVQDWTGTAEFVGAVPPAMPGEKLNFEGYTAPDNDIYGGTGRVYSGPAIVDSITLNWNWEGGEGLNGTIAYSGYGPLIGVTQYIDDLTDPDEYPICNTRIRYGEIGSEADLDEPTSATLTITAENVTSVTARTDCWTGREAGPIDWTLAIDLQNNEKPLGVGTSHRILLYVDDTTFWDLRWGLVESATGFTVDRDTGEIISYTLNMVMDSFVTEHGHIILPDLTQFWPVDPQTTLATVAGKNDSPVEED